MPHSLRFRPNFLEAILESRILPAPYSLLPSGASSSVSRPAFASGPAAVGSFGLSAGTMGTGSSFLFPAPGQGGPSSGPGGVGSTAIVYPMVGQRYFGSGFLYGVAFGFPVGLTSGPDSGGGGSGYGGESGADPNGSPSGPPAAGIDIGTTVGNGTPTSPGRANDSSSANPTPPTAPPADQPLPLDLRPPVIGNRDALIHPSTPPAR
jgi:hypothetical protein